MATILATICIKAEKQFLIPPAVVVGFALDFIIIYQLLKK
jgi:hypothetical protein